MAIRDPKNYLNKYCIELSKLPGIEITKVNQEAKKELAGLVPGHYFTECVDSIFKDQSQLIKGKLRHQEELTKEAKVKRISNWLKKQPKDFIDSFYEEAIETVEPEIESEKYLK